METLQDIKNQYAQEQSYDDWRELQEFHSRNPRQIEIHMNEICIRAQKAALEKAAEILPSSKIIESNGEEGGLRDGELQLFWEGAVWMKNTVTKSITNPENLIR